MLNAGTGLGAAPEDAASGEKGKEKYGKCTEEIRLCYLDRAAECRKVYTDEPADRTEDRHYFQPVSYTHLDVYKRQANILAHNEDLAGAEAYFKELGEIGPDALIISDPGIFDIARRILPDVDIHISTQANNTNYGTYQFWWRLGAKRVVSARELSLQEIRQIRENIPEEMEIESFIHGAMCISYSGRCLLSNFLAGRDANHEIGRAHV